MISRNILFATVVGALCANAQGGDHTLTENELIYTNEEMLNFNIDDYLRTYAPHLSPYSENISHWAGFSSISPKILLALMELQSSIISSKSSSGIARPFAFLSDETGFNEQLKDISNQLAELHYEQANNASHKFSVLELLSSKCRPDALLDCDMRRLSESFSSTYYKLFPVDSD